LFTHPADLITKTYKKISNDEVSSITSEDKAMAEQMELDDRITIAAKKPAFITIKDHKANYMTNPTCRLINPTKPEIGKLCETV